MIVFRWTARRLILAALVMSLLGGAYAQQAAPAPLPPLPAAPAGPLTVEEAVAFALQNNPAITLGVENVQISRSQVDAARAGRLPRVGVNATAMYDPSLTTIAFEGKDITTGSHLSASAQLAASQPVWPSSRWRAPIQSAEAAVGLNSEALLRTQQQVVLQTRQAFFQHLNAQELLGVSEYSVRVAQEQLRLARATFEAGVAPRVDVEQAQASLSNAEVNLLRTQNDVDISRAALATQLGLPAGTPIAITPPEGLPTVPEQVDPLVATALSQRPEIVQLNYRRQQLRANIALIRLQQQPLVDVQAGYNQPITGGSLFGSDGLSFSASAALNLYNGGQTKAELAAARTQLAQVDTQAQQVELGITFEVRQAWLNLQNALRQLITAEQQRVAADEALRIAELRYREGEGILLEVEQARLLSTQARTTLTQARFLAQIAAAQLQFALGTPVVQEPSTQVEAPAAG